MRLWMRLTLAVALLAVVPVLIVGTLAVRTTHESARLRPEEALTREASTLATFVDAWVTGQASSLQGWHRVWDLQGKDPDYQVGLARAVYRAMEGAVTVALVDPAGQPLVPPVYLTADQVGPGRTPGSPDRARALLAAVPAADPSGVALGTPYLAPGAAHPSVPIRAGLPDGSVHLLAEVSLEPVSRALGARGDGVALVTGEGAVVLGADHPLARAGALDEVLALDGDLSFSRPVDDGEVRGALVRVPSVGWRVLVSEPSGLADEAIRTIRVQTGLVGLLVLAVVTGLALILERVITRPLDELRRFTVRIAEGDYDHPMRFRRRDELGELADGLRDMAARLSDSRDEILSQKREIERFNEALQARVEARTAELRQAQAELVRTGQIAAVAEVGAGLAHELNNPLTVILGYVQLMRAKGEGDQAVLERLEAEAHRCRAVVETMVRFAEGEVDPAGTSVVDLPRIVGEHVAAMRSSYRQRGVSLVHHAPQQPMRVRLDPALAEQLVTSVLSALRAGIRPEADARGRLDLGWDRADGVVILTLTPEPPVATEASHDDWMAAGVQLWAARRIGDLHGGAVVAPTDDGGSPDGAWRVELPEA